MILRECECVEAINTKELIGAISLYCNNQILLHVSDRM